MMCNTGRCGCNARIPVRSLADVVDNVATAQNLVDAFTDLKDQFNTFEKETAQGAYVEKELNKIKEDISILNATTAQIEADKVSIAVYTSGIADLDTRKANIAYVDGEITKVDNKLNGALVSITALQNRVTTLENRFETALTRITTGETERAALQSEIDSLTARVAALETPAG